METFDYETMSIAPGSYVYTFEVSTSPGQSGVTKSFQVTFELPDPCTADTVSTKKSKVVD